MTTQAVTMTRFQAGHRTVTLFLSTASIGGTTATGVTLSLTPFFDCTPATLPEVFYTLL